MKRCLSTSLAIALALHLGVPSPAFAAQDPEALKAQQMEYAKAQFQEGEELLAKGNFKGAIEKYELAYQYAPEFHVLNFNIGVAANQDGDCRKAKTAFQRFLDLVPDHPMRADAQKQLMELEKKGCATTPPPAPGSGGGETEAAPILGGDTEDPLASGGEGEGEGEGETDKPKKKRKKGNPLVLGGYAAIGAGGALIVVGAVTGIITRRNANKLNEMAQPGVTGFSPASYADDEVFQLDLNRKRLGVATTILVPLGVAAAGAGVAMLLLGKKKGKKDGSGADGEEEAPKKDARRSRVELAGVGASATRSGVAAGAAFRF